MLSRILLRLSFTTIAGLACGQSAFIQDGVDLPGGGTYDGTIDTEFRAASPTTEQGSNPNISIDDFDGGFQTQAAIRFDDLLISQGGLVPDQVATGGFDLVFAELRIWVTSPTAADAIINFNRVIAPDTTSGAFWQEDDTWASLGGDLIPDQGGFLDGDPILEDGTEAAATPDFTVPLPAEDPIYNTATDSQDVLRALLPDPAAATSQEKLDAIEQSFFRFDVTDAISDWLIDGEPNFGWSINNNTGNGWDFLSSDVALDNTPDFTQAGVAFDGIDGPAVDALRPVLTVIYASPGGRGDLDFDGDVDLDDYQLLLDNLAIELDGAIATGATGDLDFDRDVDLDDFAIFKNEFAIANGAGSLAAALAVPEPSAVLLAGLCGLLGVARRR